MNGEPRPPGRRLARMALASTVRHQAQLVKTLASGLPGVPGLAKQVLPDFTGEAGSQLRAPSTRFGDKVTADRAFDGTVIELDDVAAVRNLVEGATVNDVILSIVGGALRRYLRTHGELPDMSLLSAVPVSLRAEGDTTPGNQVSVMALSLHTDVADPVERLVAIHASAVGARRVADALGPTHLADAAAHVPPAVAAVGTRLIARLGLNQQARRLFNTTVTNVPGPRAPQLRLRSPPGRSLRVGPRARRRRPLPRRHGRRAAHLLVGHVMWSDAARPGVLPTVP